MATVKRFNCRPTLYAVVGAVGIFLPLALTSADGVILYVLIAAIVCLILFIHLARARRQLRLPWLAALIVHGVMSFALSKSYYDVRVTLRWLLWAKYFKAEVLVRPDRSNHGWQHVEWDGWGWAGMNTVAYIVYNPSNLLADAARSHVPGVVLTPAPCLVSRVRRLEDSWYAVVFYTDTDWEHGDGTGQ